MRGALPEAVRILIGHVCHHFGLAPPARSVLERLFGVGQERGPWRYFDVCGCSSWPGAWSSSWGRTSSAR
eukprot:11189988-Lingulodinium_polyedra.AAC.1